MSTGDDAPKDERLLPTAEDVAEGRPVDWGARSGHLPDLSGPLANLHAIERLAAACRTPVPAGGAPEAVRFRWGELEAVEKLGEGAFGEVWRAWDPALQRHVALKLEHAAAERRARPSLEEARRLARVRHEGVVAIHGMDVRDGRAGLWMDLVAGATLEEELATRGPLGAREVVGVCVELCRALAAVHDAGLVHGDVKPANVMRERGGRIVLMDFGAGAAGRSLGAITGTPLASAPEVIAGSAPDPRSDLWSLGALAFRLLTGRWPVEADSLPALADRHARGDRLSLRTLRPDLPPSVVAAVERALAADPGARFAHAGAMESAFVAALPGARETARRGRAAIGLAALGALVLIVAWAAWPRRAERTVAPPAASPVRSATEPAPPAPLLAELRFYRAHEGVAEPVDAGALVGLGDELWMRVACAESAHVYVLNEDDRGAVFALFPVAGTDLRNPLPPGRRFELPGAHAGEPMHWEISTPATRERFLVVAARGPLAALEEQVARLEPARADAPLAYAEVDDGLIARLRGAGRRTRAAPARLHESRLDRIVASLDGERGVWIRQVEFRHAR